MTRNARKPGISVILSERSKHCAKPRSQCKKRRAPATRLIRRVSGKPWSVHLLAARSVYSAALPRTRGRNVGQKAPRDAEFSWLVLSGCEFENELRWITTMQSNWCGPTDGMTRIATKAENEQPGLLTGLQVRVLMGELANHVGLCHRSSRGASRLIASTSSFGQRPSVGAGPNALIDAQGPNRRLKRRVVKLPVGPVSRANPKAN
jgi:hypothetical protein